MAGESMSVLGIPELTAALDAMGGRLDTATRVAVSQAAALAEGKARAELSRSSHARGTPTPSAPGEPPSLITGRLRGSFHVVGPTAAGAAAWMSVLGPTAVYARIQELGGETGRGHRTVLPPRPYVRPAAESLRRDPVLMELFVRAWRAAIG